jgi:hypothetical protein
MNFSLFRNLFTSHFHLENTIKTILNHPLTLKHSKITQKIKIKLIKKILIESNLLFKHC